MYLNFHDGAIFRICIFVVSILLLCPRAITIISNNYARLLCFSFASIEIYIHVLTYYLLYEDCIVKLFLISLLSIVYQLKHAYYTVILSLLNTTSSNPSLTHTFPLFILIHLWKKCFRAINCVTRYFYISIHKPKHSFQQW